VESHSLQLNAADAAVGNFSNTATSLAVGIDGGSGDDTIVNAGLVTATSDGDVTVGSYNLTLLDVTVVPEQLDAIGDASYVHASLRSTINLYKFSQAISDHLPLPVHSPYYYSVSHGSPQYQKPLRLVLQPSQMKVSEDFYPFLQTLAQKKVLPVVRARRHHTDTRGVSWGDTHCFPDRHAILIWFEQSVSTRYGSNHHLGLWSKSNSSISHNLA
jgi:hypothetical protein